ncbi:hypothetical protein FRB96_001256 [Tulasnella sp. 330]|nr:hypothetical protein FRB96_001256 [Tulasnella sp. 330]KAG8874839.1 hypothetical protein FRB97_005619 [Tulasnella sp. 331]KAG8877212.1 hypothetical protein FRB98_006825 [Tulasnella sp. 332]
MVSPFHPVPSPSAQELTMQSVEVPNTQAPGQTGRQQGILYMTLLDLKLYIYLFSSQRTLPQSYVKGLKTLGRAAFADHNLILDWTATWDDLQGKLGRATLPELFESGLAQAADRPCLGHRELISTGSEPAEWAPEYIWETYTEINIRRKAVGSAIEGLFRSGVCPAGTDFEGVGIWAINRPEWQIVDLAAGVYKKVTVALYDTLGPRAVEYVINHAELSVVFCSANHVSDLIKNSANCPTLRVIVSFDPIDAPTKALLLEAATKTGVMIKDFRERKSSPRTCHKDESSDTGQPNLSVESEGKKNPIEPIKANLDQLASVCYTSGTTSDPKGVMLSHRALATAVLAHMHGLADMPVNWIVISYLPLAHIYGRVADMLALASGGCVGYFTGSPANLFLDMQILKPHMFPSVPRILTRLYSKVQAQAQAPGIKGALFRRAVDSKMYYFKSTGSVTSHVWDYLVFSQIQAMLGGRVKLIFMGSAPINKDVLAFLKISLSCKNLLEGYGLSETCACATRTLGDDPSAGGTVGGPSMSNELKLVDVPALGYHSTDKPNPRGEICVRGDNVFKKYYKDEKATNAAIESDGWFHTGDVGEVDSAGRFKIIDRVKNIMKLSQGEYVALEKVENVYSTHPIVKQSYIHGDSLQDFLVAIVVVEPKALSQIANKAGCQFDHTSPAAFATAMEDPKVKKATLDSITVHAKKSGLKGFEMVRDIHLTSNQFTVENNTMTPTFKIRRKDAHKMYKDAIDAMYMKKAQ